MIQSKTGCFYANFIYHWLLKHSMDYLIMCIGNRDSGDDAIGPYIADILKEECDNFVVLVDDLIATAGTASAARNLVKKLGGNYC
jgi:phosphoribosylpyrophosphate synthetase